MDSEAGKLVKATKSLVKHAEAMYAGTSDPDASHNEAGQAVVSHTVAEINARVPFRARRFVLAFVAALVIALSLMATVAQEVWAAIELAYYRGAATNNAVFLEWATVREVGIHGFEILCKRVQDPESSFHPIGSRIALGSPTSGATYNFDVTSGLVPGQAYCFRLREITKDNTPGEAFDLCGFGLGITPQPTTVPVSVEVSIPVTLTPTVLAVTQVPGLPAAPTLAPTVDPFATPTFTPPPTIDPFAVPTATIDPFAVPTATIDPFATPTFTPSPTPTFLSEAQSPLPSPTMTLTPGVSLQDDGSSVAGIDTTAMPGEEMLPASTPPVTPTVSEMPTEMPTATPTWTETPTATLTNTLPITNTETGQLPLVVDPNQTPTIPEPVIPDNGSAVVMVDATPTPIYVVVTATPTPVAQVVAIPTFTPWPTAVPTQSFGLSNLLVPNTQNLMVGLLGLIFISASGLGALGLVTSVLYMRSQTRRDRLSGPSYDRRRY